MSSPVLGIDLGTTNSVVASIDDGGEVVVLPNALGEDTTPSAVYFESAEEVVVGYEARRLAALDPENGVTLIKRHMGTDFPRSLRGRPHTPESISALILRSLVSQAASAAAPRAVITVPAYFGTREREATAQAGRIAGIDVLELVDEPVAAAIHYGLVKPGNHTVLVFDLGGGTFDTTVLTVADGHVTVVATDGHSKLGGADVDERLLTIVLERLSGLIPAGDHEDLLDDEIKLADLQGDIEDAKRLLSARSECRLVIRTATDEITVPLTREDLEDACADLFVATTDVVERLRATAAAKGVTDLDEVIMVGGSSRITALAARLQEQLGLVPRMVDPDLAVAKGAALRAHQIVGSTQIQALARTRGLTESTRPGTITPVVPRAVGLLIDDSHDPEGRRQFVAHLIHANTALPAQKTTRSFGTILANQGAVRIQVFEQAGSSPSEAVEHNHRVLDGELSGLGSLPAGSVIEVTVAMAIDGRLTVVAREPGSGVELTLEAFVEGVVDSVEAEDLKRTVGLLAVRE
jgi:molecular chaperone DnaK (HSP70)